MNEQPSRDEEYSCPSFPLHPSPHVKHPQLEQTSQCATKASTGTIEAVRTPPTTVFGDHGANGELAQRILKRGIDISGAMIGLVLLSPLFMVIAILVKRDSPGSIFYAHTRVGKKGRRFTCYKFRSMVPNANAQKNQLRHLNELGNGFFFKIQKDPRLTRVGSFLRRYSLDELPQLFNVLKGDMSLVGPRPSPIDEFEMYDISHFRRLDVKPGLTGLWQIIGRRDPDFDRAMKVDGEYVDRWNLWLDLKILVKTFPVIFQGE